MRRAELALKLLILNDETDPLWNQTLEPVDKAETPIVRVDLAAALAAAETRRPELADARALVAQSDVDVAFTKDRLKPQLDLVAGYARRGLAGGLNPNAPATGFLGSPIVVPDALDGSFGRSFGTIAEGRFPDASVGLALTVPVFNRTAKGDVAIAKARKSQAEILLARHKQRVAVDVRNAVLTLDTAAQRIDAAKAGRSAAETQLRAEKERYGVGLSTNFFVLTRQNDLALGRPHRDRRPDGLSQGPDRLRAAPPERSSTSGASRSRTTLRPSGPKGESEHDPIGTHPDSRSRAGRARRLRLLARGWRTHRGGRTDAGTDPRARRAESRAASCRASSR